MNNSDSPFLLANPPAVVYVDPDLFKQAKSAPERLVPVIDFMTEDDLWAMQEEAEVEAQAHMGRQPHYDDFSLADLY